MRDLHRLDLNTRASRRARQTPAEARALARIKRVHIHPADAGSSVSYIPNSRDDGANVR